MKFTGKNLELVGEALQLALCEVHNMIATCPDVIEYAEDIEEYKAKKVKIQRLKTRVDLAIEKGGSTE